MFTFLIHINNQLIIHIIRLEMLFVSVCLLEDVNLIEEHVSSNRGFPSYIKKIKYVSMWDFLIVLLLNKGVEMLHRKQIFPYHISK